LNLRSFTNSKSNTHQALWVAMGSLSSFALSIVSAAILSRYFDKTEYGTYRQILYVYNTLLVVFSAGLPRVFGYFLPRYTLAKGSDIVWKVTKVLFIAGLTFSVFLFGFSGLIANALNNPELARGLKYFSFIPMLLLPTLGIEGIFSTYKKTIFIAIYNTLTRIFMLLFIVLPVILFKGSYILAIYGWIIASGITLALAYFFKGIPFRGVKTEQSGLTVKEIFRFSLPLVVASVAGIAIKAADQFYISRYFGTEVFAEFANGFIELPFVYMITGATATVLMPIFSKIIYDKSDVTQIENIWQTTLQKSAIIIYPLVIFFIFFANEVVIVLYSAKYSGSYIYFTIAMTINFFNVIVFAPLLIAMGETKFYSQLHIGMAIITWIIGYLIVIIFKTPIAIAVFSAIKSISLVIIALTFSARRLKIGFLKLFPIISLLKVSFHSLISVIIVKYLIKVFFLAELNNLAILAIAFAGFSLILMLTSPIFKIRYIDLLKSLINK
jgi:O-antigen/teichoic acid export membrane protein